MPKKQKGFTLIEILVAISIISILSGFIIISLQSAVNGGKDSRRKSDLTMIKNAIDLYAAEHSGAVPQQTPVACNIGGGCFSSIDPVLQTMMKTIPSDPDAVNSYTYYSSDGKSCTITAILSDSSAYQLSCSSN